MSSKKLQNVASLSLGSSESVLGAEQEVPPQGPASLAFQFSAPATPSVVRDWQVKKKTEEEPMVRTLSAPVDCGKKSSAAAKSRKLRKNVAQKKQRYRGMFISDEKAAQLEKIRDEQCKRRQETLKKKQESWEAKAKARAAQGKKPMGRQPSFRCARLGTDVPTIEIAPPEKKKRGRPKKHTIPWNIRRAMQRKQEKAEEQLKMASKIAGDHVDDLLNEDEEDWQEKYIQQLGITGQENSRSSSVFDMSSSVFDMNGGVPSNNGAYRQTTELRSASVLLNQESSFTHVEKPSHLNRQESLVSIAGEEEEYEPAKKKRKIAKQPYLCRT